jgi:hypothetical protein
MVQLATRIIAGLLPVFCFFAPEFSAPSIYTPLLLCTAALATLWPTTHWQLMPAQLGWWLAAVGLPTCASLVGTLSIVALTLIPLPEVEGVAGPFGVGVVDYASSTDAPTLVLGRLFYPTSERGGVAPYLAYGNMHHLTRKFIYHASPSVLRPYLPVGILSHWKAMRIRACPDAPLLSTSAPLPVVVFSHGLTASREKGSSLALSLAARGVVVALVEHTDRSATLSRSSQAVADALEYAPHLPNPNPDPKPKVTGALDTTPPFDITTPDP